VADVRLHVLPHAGRPHRVELQAHRGCSVCGHCGRVGHRRAVQQWRRARRLRSGAHHGGHALDGADARDRRVSRHGRHGGRAHHVSACRDPVDAERATRQTGTIVIGLFFRFNFLIPPLFSHGFIFF